MGAVTPLAQAEEAPLLGQLPEGKSVLTLESGMFRAAAVPHTPSECAQLASWSVRDADCMVGADAQAWRLPVCVHSQGADRPITAEHAL